ncbi:MAG: asparagine synthase (glutamine-hydrolyzing) [Phycisphaerales bacterium]|nr:asparagine synthase (glutamine-hydrolyzing) [Phycisphaerales bacterium]
MAHLRRRGPDGEGTSVCPSGHAALGHTRLAILDLSPAGAQPMASEDGQVVVTYNGEIYNAPDLREQLESLGHRFVSRSDTEVLLHGYRAWGARGMLDRLRGMFALVLWDAPARRAVAAVDHAGMKPLLWASTADGVFVASDLDALCAVLPERPALDPIGLGHVLCLGYCPAPWTVRRGVRKLGPGEGWTWSPGGEPRSFRHWAPPHEAGPASEPFDPLWEQIVREHTLADVPLGLLLSGGLDSSAVALALARQGAAVDCTTIALPGAADEAPSAGETAALLGLRHRSVALEAGDAPGLLREAAGVFDEPQGFGALLTMTRVASAARRGGKAVLAGDGGDEAFAGYLWHRAEPRGVWGAGIGAETERLVASADATGAVRQRAMRSLADRSFLHAYLQSVMPRFHPAEAAAMLAPLGGGYDETVYAEWLAPHDRARAPWPRRAQLLDLAGFCAGSILPKLDRATMGHGLELRAPFLDRRVLEWALARPVEAGETDASTAKPPVRRYLAGRVPGRVLTRDKQGFSLRLGQPDLFSGMLPWLGTTRLVRDGVLGPGWEGFVAPDAPNREGRAFVLCMLGAWAEERI